MSVFVSQFMDIKIIKSLNVQFKIDFCSVVCSKLDHLLRSAASGASDSVDNQSDLRNFYCLTSRKSHFSVLLVSEPHQNWSKTEEWPFLNFQSVKLSQIIHFSFILQ